MWSCLSFVCLLKCLKWNTVAARLVPVPSCTNLISSSFNRSLNWFHTQELCILITMETVYPDYICGLVLLTELTLFCWITVLMSHFLSAGDAGSSQCWLGAVAETDSLPRGQMVWEEDEQKLTVLVWWDLLWPVWVILRLCGRPCLGLRGRFSPAVRLKHQRTAIPRLMLRSSWLIPAVFWWADDGVQLIAAWTRPRPSVFSCRKQRSDRECDRDPGGCPEQQRHQRPSSCQSGGRGRGWRSHAHTARVVIAVVWKRDRDSGHHRRRISVSSAESQDRWRRRDRWEVRAGAASGSDLFTEGFTAFLWKLCSCLCSDVSAGLDLDLDLDDSSSGVTAGGSDEQQEFSDSASFSIPSLELSDGLTAAAAVSSMDMEDSLSLSCSAPGPETSSASTQVPGLKEEGLAGADGEAPSGGEKTNKDI